MGKPLDIGRNLEMGVIISVKGMTVERSYPKLGSTTFYYCNVRFKVIVRFERP